MSEENQAPDPLAQGGPAPAEGGEGPAPVEGGEGPAPVDDSQSDPLAQQAATKKREQRFQALSNENKELKQQLQQLQQGQENKSEEPANTEPDKTGDAPKETKEETPQGPVFHPSIEAGLEAAITNGKYDQSSIKSISAKVGAEIPELADPAFVTAMVNHTRSEAWVDAIQDNPTFMRNLEQVVNNHPGDDPASQKRRLKDFEYIISHAPHYNGGESLIRSAPESADPVKPPTDPLRTPPKPQQGAPLPNAAGWKPDMNNGYDVATLEIMRANPNLNLEQARRAAFKRATAGW